MSTFEWKIEYWVGLDTKTKSTIERWLDNLPDDHLKAIAKELKLLQISGNELRLTHSKSLGKGLFELRERNMVTAFTILSGINK